MSRDYKLNKSELSRLKREEKLYCQYVPVLKLKLAQIQLEELRIRKSLSEVVQKREQNLDELKPYVPLFSDSYEREISTILVVEHIRTVNKSVAGLNLKAFGELIFKPITVPYFQTAPWLLRAVPLIKRLLVIEAQLVFLEQEQKAMRKELRRATRTVNLFDMVLIPKAQVAIKRIRIALQDEQVASISRGKKAKDKLQTKKECL